MNNLLYRRQFIFLNKASADFDDWGKHVIANQGITWYLYSHPDLFVYRGRNPNFELLLIGHILDPFKPEHDNKAIIDDLLLYGEFEELISGIDHYTGRFSIIYSDNKELKILHDATGFREIYYTFFNTVCCGSTPNLIAETCKIPKTNDQEIWSFYHSKEFSENDNTWVGYKTLFEGVFHLPPNHFLDLNNKQKFRFWPRKSLKRIDIESCAKECAEILKGTIQSSLIRYPIHIGITAGWDTRLILASTKDFKEKIFYYINDRSSKVSKSKDIEIATRLSKMFGFKLNTIKINESVDDNFRNSFLRNNVLAREKLLPVFYEIYKRNWQDTYTISGTMGNGLARIYMRLPQGSEINGTSVAVYANYGRLKYATSALDEWVSSVKSVCLESNINIMDLYQWEQDNAHWASLASSEQDIVREEIRPFNNRRLIEIIWSLDEKYRYQYNPIIYSKIIDILWKDVMKIPLNPSTKTYFYKLLRVLGIEREVYRYYKKRKFTKSLISLKRDY
jgi:hypothetical protein